LEAMMLGIYLTRDIPEFTRIPLRFGSQIQGQTFWHIVLAVSIRVKIKSGDAKQQVVKNNTKKQTHKIKWGALGLSRRADLAYKPLEFDSLSDLVESYKTAYKGIGHRISKITVGLPVGTAETSVEKVYYHFLCIPIKSWTSWDAVRVLLDRYTKAMHKILRGVKTSGHYMKLEDTVYCRCLELQHNGLLYKPDPPEQPQETTTSTESQTASQGSLPITVQDITGSGSASGSGSAVPRPICPGPALSAPQIAIPSSPVGGIAAPFATPKSPLSELISYEAFHEKFSDVRPKSSQGSLESTASCTTTHSDHQITERGKGNSKERAKSKGEHKLRRHKKLKPLPKGLHLGV